MCTIGAMSLGAEGYVLFKNKDFASTSFDDRVTLNEGWFGPLGDSGSTSYDVLTELALSDASSVESAVLAITDRVNAQSHWWGNLVLADESQLAVVEIRGSQILTEFASEHVVRANHQPLFGEQTSPDGLSCSAPRLEAAHHRMESATTLDDVFDLLSAHDDGDTGICNHGDLTTVYSYLLHCRDGETTLHLVHGNPCKNKRTSMIVPFGNRWTQAARNEFMRWYPGGTPADS